MKQQSPKRHLRLVKNEDVVDMHSQDKRVTDDPSPGSDSLSERIDRIKASINRINQLMAELKSVREDSR